MLNKLIKYDFKSMGKELLFGYVIALALAIFTRVLTILSDYVSIFSFLAIPTKGIFYMVLVGLIFYTFLIPIKRYYKNIFRDEGYLTNTLPVSRTSILISKIITSIIFLLITICVILISFYIGEGSFHAIIQFVNLGLELQGLNLVLTYSMIGILLILTYLAYLLIVFAAIAIGHAKDASKLANSFVAGIIIYFINQGVAVLCLGIVFLFYPHIINALETTPVSQIIYPLLGIATLLEIIYNIVYFLIAKQTYQTKLRLD